MRLATALWTVALLGWIAAGLATAAIGDESCPAFLGSSDYGVLELNPVPLGLRCRFDDHITGGNGVAYAPGPVAALVQLGLAAFPVIVWLLTRAVPSPDRCRLRRELLTVWIAVAALAGLGLLLLVSSVPSSGLRWLPTVLVVAGSGVAISGLLVARVRLAHHACFSRTGAHHTPAPEDAATTTPAIDPSAADEPASTTTTTP